MAQKYLNASLRGAPRRRWIIAALLASLWLAAASTAAAVEFGSPPGINVTRQEQQLKREILSKAKDLVGPGLVDVIVNITYARKGADKGGQRLKLPGFDRFITVGAENDLGIEAEFLRMRQVTVIVDDNLKQDTERIERELNSAGKFVRANGDILKVTTRSDSGGLSQAGKGDGRFDRKPRRRRSKAGTATNEPESTVHLLRARTAYFKEDYNRALDHILNAIEVEPRSPLAYSMLGSLYFTINWKHLAVKYWEMSLDLDPDNRELEDLVASVLNSN